MTKKSDAPAIRFKGFSDAWEQRKLGDISEIKTGPFGSTLHADDYVSDGTPIITTEHFKTGALPRSKNGLPQVSDSDYKRLTAYTLDDGDIVFSRVGSVDINALITPFQSNWLFSGRVLRVRPQTDISSKFLHTRLETESIKTDIRTRAVGQTMPSINTEILKITPLVLPSSAAEQKQIGSYFAALDHLITLHQRKFEKLTNVKKSMLEKMFPQNGSCYPAVRFKGFTGPWERRKFGDVFEEYSEKNRADLPPLTIIQGSGTIRRDESERALQYDKASLSNYKVVNEGDLIVHLRSFEGGLEKANSQGIISPAYHTFHGEGVDSRFYYTYFRSKNFIDTDLKPHVYGIRDGRSIDIEGMKTIEIPFTSYPEQKLIGDAIDSINTLISLQRRELEKLQSIKKALLEKMFV